MVLRSLAGTTAMSKTYLEFRDGSSGKFWEITVEGARHKVRFGKIGTAGQTKLKTFASESAARAAADALVREKTKKGYAAVATTVAEAQAASGVRSLIDALVAATQARLAKEDDETREHMKPRVRPPATAAQIKTLERAWKRALPPTYRAFLEVCNGIENVGGTQLLLGTEDHANDWAAEQVESISEFWDDDAFDLDELIPLAVPDGDSGIHHFAAFTRGDGEEMEIVDWDEGVAHARCGTFEGFLKRLVAIEEACADGSDEAPASQSEPVREPEISDLEPYLTKLGRDVVAGAPDAFARAERIFDPELVVAADHRALWIRTMNDAIARSFRKIDPERAARWADVARPFVRENPYLGHNLACAFVAVGRVDDAIAMCKAAVDVGYSQLAKMRTDADLGPLLEEPRFQALFGPADRTEHAPRLSLPRNRALEAAVAAGESVAAYGAWLTKEKHALGAIVLADLAAEAEPKKERKAKTTAKRLFEAYRKDVLEPAFPHLGKRMTHFLDKEYYLSFRYGFLEKLDTFVLNTPEEREEALALLADPHAMFVRHVALRKAKLDRLDAIARLRGVRQLNFRWTDITQVRSLAPLAELAQLRALDVDNSAIEDLRPIAALPLLQLYCSHTGVVDLSPLTNHPTLSHLALEHGRVADLRPLLTCKKLCRVDLWGTPLPKREVDALRRHLEKMANEPVLDDALMSGYEPGVSHEDA